MLGRQPLDALDDQRVMAVYFYCWSMNPEEGYPFLDQFSELTAKEQREYAKRIEERDPMGGRPEAPDAARAGLLALIAQEEERLEAALAGHLERDDAALEAALAFDATPAGEQLRKYEQTIDRALLKIVETLRKRHEPAEETTPSRRRASGTAGSTRSGGRAAVPAGSDPGERASVGTGPDPSDKVPVQTAAADALAAGEIPAPVARTAEAPAVSPEPVFVDIRAGFAFEGSAPTPAATAACPDAEVEPPVRRREGGADRRSRNLAAGRTGLAGIDDPDQRAGCSDGLAGGRGGAGFVRAARPRGLRDGVAIADGRATIG